MSQIATSNCLSLRISLAFLYKFFIEISCPFDILLSMQEKQIKDVSLSAEIIRENVYIIRGQKVMLDRDLAMLYGVQTMRLNEAVRRNLDRFPEDIMFQLTKEEFEICSRSQFATLNISEEKDANLISQIAISSSGSKNKGNLKSQFVTSSWGGSRKGAMAFTEQGIAMLSSVLNSKTAIQVNIQIIRAFTKMREMIDAYKDLREKVEEMELNNEFLFNKIFKSIKSLTYEKKKPKGKFGFVADK